MKSVSNWVIYGVTSLIGLLSFGYPFFIPSLRESSSLGYMRVDEMPIMLSVLLALCVAILLFELQIHTVDAKIIALIGVLVAINSTLRFIEVAIPGPGGFSPIFFLIILTGYVFGSRIGFLMGALTLLVSAFATGGVGPWLPSQTFAAGWVGMSAGLLALPVRYLKLGGKVELGILVVFGSMWGILFGIIMNLWSWPFLIGPADQYWAPGTGLMDTIQRYGTFYLVTSLIWDLGRSVGNALMLILFGIPTIRLLLRFKKRFLFHYQPELAGGTGD
jgi:energy-coupling factor transport system substrate-specific component